MHTRHLSVYGVAGAIAFATTQYLLIASSGGSTATMEGGPGWFLNTGTSLAIVTGVLATASALVTAVMRPSNVWPAAGAFALGASVAMAVALFIVGPGTIFPIVIAIGGLCIAIAAIAGAYAGVAVRSLWSLLSLFGRVP
jgi:hypothetical protein